MKKIALLIAAFYTITVRAQTCKDYYFLQPNKTIEMTISDKKGNASGKLIYTVSNVSNKATITAATVNSEVYDKKGKLSGKGTTEMQCNNGVLMMDMKMMIPQQQAEQSSTAQAKADNVFMEYPASMKPGDHLKDGHMFMEMNTSGMPQTLTYNVTDRKVEAKERITTPAGTWDCYRITFKGKLNVKMMIGINLNMDGTEWYAPGFGVVKSQNKSGGSEITAIR